MIFRLSSILFNMHFLKIEIFLSTIYMKFNFSSIILYSQFFVFLEIILLNVILNLKKNKEIKKNQK